MLLLPIPNQITQEQLWTSKNNYEQAKNNYEQAKHNYE